MSNILDLAREALEDSNGILSCLLGDFYEQARAQMADNASAIEAINAAPLQQKQEPVAWLWQMHGWVITAHGKHRAIKRYVDLTPPPRQTKESPNFVDCIPLYATPVAKQPADQWNAAIEAAAEICRKKQCRPEFEPELHDKLLKHAEDEIRALAKQEQPSQPDTCECHGTSACAAEEQPSQPEASNAAQGDLVARLQEMRDAGYTADWNFIIATVSNACKRASQRTAQQPAQAPRNASEVMDFIGANFNIREADPENPSDADVYQVTAHDLLSSFREWFDDWDAAPSTQQGGGQ